MAFIDKISCSYDDLLIESGMCNSNKYTHTDYIKDILEIEKAIHEATSTYLRTVNESAIRVILEDASSTDLVAINDNVKDKLSSDYKSIWEKIQEVFFKAVNSIYSWFYDQVVLHTSYIEKHKSDIMKTTIIYEKQREQVLDSNKKVIADFTVKMSQPELKIYSKLINFDSITPLMRENELKDYLDDDGNIKKEDIFEYYKSSMLGNEDYVSISTINNSKEKLLSNLTKVYNGVKSRRQEVSKLRTQKVPSSLSEEDIQRYKKFTNNQVISLKEYIKVLLIFCKEDSKLLRLFIKNKNTGENKEKKEDK